MECEFPTINSNMDEVKEIFDSVKTIAILGLSPDETKASHRVAKYLQ
jgi:predicted CoA-binding protein